MATNQAPDVMESEKASRHEGSLDMEAANRSLDPAAGLTAEHREYLQTRHGRTDLIPIPTTDPGDPLNWPSSQKHIVLFLVSFHSMMSTFSAAAVIPAFPIFAQQFGITVQKASYLTSVVIVFLGVFPLFWTAISNRYGRRPVYLISTLGAAVMHLVAAYMKSYGSLMTLRVFQAIFQATAIAIGASTVTEMFFTYQLGQKMGVWTLLSTLGPPGAPFIFGFVIQHKGWPWIFYILAILNLATFLGFLVFGAETLYIRDSSNPAYSAAADRSHMTKRQVFREKYMRFGRLNPKPFSIYEIVAPFKYTFILNVFIPTLSYSIVFCYTGVVLTVLNPQTFGEKFHLDAQGIGLQFISLIIGSIIGEQVGGPFADFIMNRRSRRAGRRVPEFRLIAGYLGYVTGFVGVLVWGVLLDNAGTKWIVSPDIGSGIAMFGLQIVTTVCISYAIECHVADKANVSAFIIFVRQIYAFVGPFYFTPMLENLGLQNAAITFAFLVVFAGLLIGGWDIYCGMKRRKARSD